MAAERFYIYRCGRTKSCALTATKDGAQLPHAICPSGWKFWMQITRHQGQPDRLGFIFDAAVTEIKATGYCIFAGSENLLEDRIPTALCEGTSNG